MKKSLSLLLSSFGLLCGFTSLAYASAFQLFEENAVGIGDFGAGGAAIAEDASIGFFNPAGLTRIHSKQIVASLDAVNTNFRFNGNDTWSFGPFKEFPYSEKGIAHGGTFNLIPQFHYLAPLAEKWVLGFNLTSPFGLATNYGTHSLVRYFATRTDIRSLDISPSFAYAINDRFSLGFGIDAEHIKAKLNAVAGIPVSPTNLDTLNENDASDWGYGWHTGLLYQVNPQVRIGLAYRSMIHFYARGSSKLTGPLAGGTSVSQFRNDSLSANVTLPATTMLSVYNDLNNQWSVMANLIYTQWNVFENLTLHNIQSVVNKAPQLITVNLPQNFHNTWRFALGTRYKVNEQWQLRMGTGYDQTPTNGNDRNLRLPDGDRYALALGGHYQATASLGFDLGWTHLFIKSSTINLNTSMGNQNTYTYGRASGKADVFGTQLVWNVN